MKNILDIECAAIQPFVFSSAHDKMTFFASSKNGSLSLYKPYIVYHKILLFPFYYLNSTNRISIGAVSIILILPILQLYHVQQNLYLLLIP